MYIVQHKAGNPPWEGSERRYCNEDTINISKQDFPRKMYHISIFVCSHLVSAAPVKAGGEESNSNSTALAILLLEADLLVLPKLPREFPAL